MGPGKIYETGPRARDGDGARGGCQRQTRRGCGRVGRESVAKRAALAANPGTELFDLVERSFLRPTRGKG